MKIDELITIVPNNRNNLFIAHPAGDNDIWFDPIVAWEVKIDTYENRIIRTTTAISADMNDRQKHEIIYNIETNVWFIPEDRSGKGKEELIKYFQED